MRKQINVDFVKNHYDRTTQVNDSKYRSGQPVCMDAKFSKDVQAYRAALELARQNGVDMYFVESHTGNYQKVHDKNSRF